MGKMDGPHTQGEGEEGGNARECQDDEGGERESVSVSAAMGRGGAKFVCLTLVFFNGEQDHVRICVCQSPIPHPPPPLPRHDAATPTHKHTHTTTTAPPTLPAPFPPPYHITTLIYSSVSSPSTMPTLFPPLYQQLQ